MARSVSALSLATALTALAVLPFAAGVYYAFAHDGGQAAPALHWLLAYLATIVSFTGGVQWGRMLAAKQAPAQDMVMAVVPALIAWPALLISQPWPFFMLLAALVIAWLADENGARQGWQGRGFLQLRRLITLIVAACMVAIGWRVLRG
ncbi:DUF3429 domain-containing protein [Salinisphaera sp. LB1]|uniref:DUF3429 domain-containing protein n=1 Tax=Salinisphaera sp. LB1 TaxID=2183911 RepID=UPI000D7086B6|nr:DUF3429 domain-containing protein [Salinisphaera sp. LB1]AWN15990.1 glutaredoxin [Salinisphaera sp. LB1]